MGFKSDHYWDTVRPLYRAVDHGQAKTVFGRLLDDRASSDDLKRLARTFVDLQSERIRADYDPHPAFRRSEASELIEQAASAVALIRKLPVETRRFLVVLLLAKHR